MLHTHTSHHWTCARACVWVSTVLLAELYDEQEAKRKAADIAENGEPDSDDENNRLVRAVWHCAVWEALSLTHSRLCPSSPWQEELDAAIHVTLGSLQLLVGKAVRGAANAKNVFNCIQTAAPT